MDTTMRIGALADAAGLTADSLRYYERIGLLPRPARDGTGHRVYQARDLAWLEFVLRLRQTGMPIAEMRRYATLRAEGPATAAARRALLAAHRDNVRAQVTALQRGLAALDAKIAIYDEEGTPSHDTD